MAEKNCACCKASLRWRVQWVSSLYGSQHLLCEPCGNQEEKKIADAGSNDLPDLLKSYGPPNDTIENEYD